ncbi:wax ester/triacylglycerol synthase domain-containing protein [Dietzia alimentaria]|uniref:wax ester/triacylglycerol synthase domain-containing protein n=1 Tax=Dietzia alimentaria TaxID=665550 RepID=UPI00031F1E93|nr:wax ester/triacylglycerol synthase domain-containing protein [Dietzia alimentaria]
MTWRDATFVYDEGVRHPEMLVACYVFATDADTKAVRTAAELRRWMHARLATAEFFTRRVRRSPIDIDHPTLVPTPELRLSEHVQLHEINGGWTALRDAISAIASRRIDLTRPPWELHAFTGATDVLGLAEITVLVLKVHHCAADGMELRRIEAALFADPARPTASTPGRPALPAETAARAFVRSPLNLVRFVRAVWRDSRSGRTRPDGAAGTAEIDQHPAPAHDRPATRFNHPSSGRLSFDIGEFRLEDVRAARSVAPGATVNDVLLTIVGGALHRLLEREGETPESSLAAMMPISLRLPDSHTGAGRGADCSGRAANQLVLGTVRLHSDMADPAARLAAVARSSAAEKARWLDPRSSRERSRMAVAPAWLLSLRASMHRVTAPPATDRRLRNTMISNLPAPTNGQNLDGAPLRAAFGVLPVVDGDRLRHLFSTSGDRMLLSVSADPEALSDLQGYLTLIREELAKLLIQRINQSVPPPIDSSPCA